MEKQIRHQIEYMLEWGNHPTKLSDVSFIDDFFYYEINYKWDYVTETVTVDRYLMNNDSKQTWTEAPFQDLELKAEIIKTFLDLLHELEDEKEAENKIPFNYYDHDPDEKYDEYKLNNN